jgi:hypothetical protein
MSGPGLSRSAVGRDARKEKLAKDLACTSISVLPALRGGDLAVVQASVDFHRDRCPSRNGT